MKKSVLRHWGDDLTSYDVLKTLALLTMIADHLGFFFFPDQDWLRILGRLSAPVWFFLIGYAGTKPVPREWWVGGVAVGISAVICQGYLFPLPILFTLGLIRLIIERFGAFGLRGGFTLFAVFVLLTILALPSTMVLEYGTFGLLCALYGYVRRHETQLNLSPGATAAFITGLVAVSVAFQAIFLPPMPGDGYIGLGIGIAVLYLGLNSFRPKTWPNALKTAPNPVRLMQFMGRWTMEIYVFHLVAFRAFAYLMGNLGEGIFAFKMFGIRMW